MLADITQSCYLILGACCLGTQFWELIITKHFDETLLKHFRMTKLAFQMLCNEIGPLVGPVLCCPIAKSRLFWCALRNLFGKIVSIVIYAGFFYRIKSLSFSIVRISFLMHIFLNLWTSCRFHPAFFNAIFQNAHKNRWMEVNVATKDEKSGLST